jgi:hypothetical protein
MGILEQLGVPEGMIGGFLGSGSLIFWFGLIFVAFVFLIVAGAITFFYYSKKIKKNLFKHQVPIFQTINGKQQRIGLDYAKEIFVPDSNISLFFLKGFKIYLARPTRAMGKNEYWYTISENGEWVNFDLSTDPEHNTLAIANYDHRDTRYAYVNLKEIIKKNYKDKSVVWWKDPVVMNIISFVIMSLIFVGACWFLIAKIGGLVNEVGQLISNLEPIANSLSDAVTNAQNINSGIIQN